MYKTSTVGSLKTPGNKRKREKIIFYCFMMAFPILQFLVFYVFINFNSILMAFQTEFQGSEPTKYGFDNFVFAWNYLKTFSSRLGNTFIFFGVNLLVDIPMSIITSYYFFKNRTASGFFKVILFLPQVISAMVLGVLYRYIFSSVSQSLFGIELTENEHWQMIILLGFNLLMSFGVNTLVFSGAMSALNQSVMESAEIDGCSSFRQFISIVLPMIYPTISTMLVMALAVVFIEQFNVYTIYGGASPNTVNNIGYQIYYWSYTNMNNTSTQFYNTDPTRLSFPQLAALGLILTAFILPITLLFRKLLDMLGRHFE